jgi:hypothetical protein
MYPTAKFICSVNIIFFNVVNKTNEINGVGSGNDGLKVGVIY